MSSGLWSPSRSRGHERAREAALGAVGGVLGRRRVLRVRGIGCTWSKPGSSWPCRSHAKTRPSRSPTAMSSDPSPFRSAITGAPTPIAPPRCADVVGPCRLAVHPPRHRSGPHREPGHVGAVGAQHVDAPVVGRQHHLLSAARHDVGEHGARRPRALEVGGRAGHQVRVVVDEDLLLRLADEAVRRTALRGDHDPDADAELLLVGASRRRDRRAARSRRRARPRPTRGRGWRGGRRSASCGAPSRRPRATRRWPGTPAAARRRPTRRGTSTHRRGARRRGRAGRRCRGGQQREPARAGEIRLGRDLPSRTAFSSS